MHQTIRIAAIDVDQTFTVTVVANTENYQLTINKEGNGTITGNDIECGNDCQQNYPNGTSITLTATPDTDWHFNDFSGDCDNTGTVVINSDKSCTATFVKQPFSLTVLIQGNGTITGENLDCDEDCTVNYAANTVVTLMAQPDPGWQFNSFDGDCDTEGQLTVSRESRCTATFTDVDGDNDSILTEIEEAAPNNGDGNGDGLKDSQQAEIVSGPDAVTGAYLTLVIQNTDCQLNHIETVSETETGYNYPQGQIAFELDNCPQTALTIYYHSGKMGEGYRQYGPTVPGDTNNTWYDLPNVSLQTVTLPNSQTIQTAALTLVDGQLGDDTAVDGRIVSFLGGLTVKDSTTTPPDGSIDSTTPGDWVVDDTSAALPASFQPTAVVSGTVTGETFTEDILVTEDASLSNTVFEGNVLNQGLVSNSTIETGITLTGGRLTGTTTNNGTIA